MMMFFRILSLSCMLILLTSGWVVSQGMQNLNNNVPTNFLLLKKNNPTEKIVFVTSVFYDGNLGGLTGADAKCKALANSAGYYGRFMAWLSDSTDSPSSRFNHATVPYVRVDGTQVAADWNDFIDGILDAPIVLDEHGQMPPGKLMIWSNTLYDGTQVVEGGLGSQHCDNWTSRDPSFLGGAGNVLFSDTNWTGSGYNNCDHDGVRIVCFEQ